MPKRDTKNAILFAIVFAMITAIVQSLNLTKDAARGVNQRVEELRGGNRF